MSLNRFATPESLGGCHVLFISTSESDHLETILDGLVGRSVLTVSDAAEFARCGGIHKELTPIENIKSAFETIKDDMRVQKACTLDDVEAFRIAMDREKESIAFFEKLAAEPGTEAERTLFGKVAAIEEEQLPRGDRPRAASRCRLPLREPLRSG